MSDTTVQDCNECGIETDCIEGICLECRLEKDNALTIDITPKWESLVPMFTIWIEEGLESQREFAKEEITRLAKIVDTFMAHRKHGGLTCKCGETFNLTKPKVN